MVADYSSWIWGGSAGNAGHMTNDIRKLTGIEAYATTDNVSELTPRINDDGWGNAFAGWLKVSLIGSMFSALSAEVSTIWVMGYPR